jgi:endoglucanase
MTSNNQSSKKSGALPRREFLKTTGALVAGASMLRFENLGQPNERPPLPLPSTDKLPLWRGFNLLEKFNARNDPFREQDFEWIAELGFNFVRLPLDYRVWIDGDWRKFKESTLKEIDQAVEFGEKYKIHVNINFHRAPGYTVARPAEEKSLWTDSEAQLVCAHHWRHFAHRYAGIPNSRVSFNLLNEPATVPPDTHRKVIAYLAEEIRKEDEGRLIICDGRDYGKSPPLELLGLNVAASTRGYEPFRLTHYMASWVGGADQWPVPDYPTTSGNTKQDKAWLKTRQIEPWQAAQQAGLGVMVGEFGAFNKTPHEVVLRWLDDSLTLWKEAGWGWALWNFRGSFGILNSGRADVEYEDWRGQKLDRQMLERLQKA